MEYPLHLHYTLDRRQRLIPHLKLWHIMGPLFVASFIIFISVAFQQNSWFFLVSFLFGWFGRGYIQGLVDVLLNRTREMDVIIEPLGIGFLIGDERYYIHLDGLLSINQLTIGVWTIVHQNGTVIHVPVDCMPEPCVGHIRAAIEGKWEYLQPFADKIKKQIELNSGDNPTT